MQPKSVLVGEFEGFDWKNASERNVDTGKEQE